jgi:hypothetical protein
MYIKKLISLLYLEKLTKQKTVLMLLGEMITNLATKVGTDSANESLKQLISLTATIEIDEELAKTFESGLLTANEAKNNPDIKAKFFSEFADATDKELTLAFKGLGLSDEQINELKASEPKTFKRISKLTDEANKLIEAKTKAGGNDEKLKALDLEYKSKISELSNQVESFKSANIDLVNQSINKEIDWNMLSFINQHKITESIPSEYRGSLAKQAVSDFFKSKDAKVVLQNGELKLKRLSDESLDVTDLDIKTGIQKALAEKNLLHVATVVPPVVTQQAQAQATKPINNTFAQNMAKAKQSNGI